MSGEVVKFERKGPEEQETRFFTFDQNNSYGKFVITEDPAIAPYMIFEAVSAADANLWASVYGLYFDGVADGRDCNCCGDRWSEQWSDDRGEDVPLIYGEPITASTSIRWLVKPGQLYTVVVYANSNIIKYRRPENKELKAA